MALLGFFLTPMPRRNKRRDGLSRDSNPCQSEELHQTGTFWTLYRLSHGAAASTSGNPNLAPIIVTAHKLIFSHYFKIPFVELIVKLWVNFFPPASNLQPKERRGFLIEWQVVLQKNSLFLLLLHCRNTTLPFYYMG